MSGIANLLTGSQQNASNAQSGNNAAAAQSQAFLEKMLQQGLGLLNPLSSGAAGDAASLRSTLAGGAPGGPTLPGGAALPGATNFATGAGLRTGAALPGAANLPGSANLPTGVFDPSQFQTDPGYQFALQQGQKAVQNAAGVQGSPFGGNAMAALDQYTTGQAQQGYQNYFNRWQAQQQLQGQFGQQQFQDVSQNAQQGWANQFQTGQTDLTNYNTARQQEFGNALQGGQQNWANQFQTGQQDWTNQFQTGQTNFQDQFNTWAQRIGGLQNLTGVGAGATGAAAGLTSTTGASLAQALMAAAGMNTEASNNATNANARIFSI